MAETQRSQVIQAVNEGEGVVVATAGESLVRLVSAQEPPPPRRFGLLEGEVKLAPDVDEPLSAEVLKGFEGE